MPFEMALSYKGERTYIQGGDFVDVIDGLLEAERGARLRDISFRTFARNQCRLWLDGPPSGASVVGSGTGGDGRGTEVRFWIEELDEELTARRPYNEDEIVAAAATAGNSITLRQQLPFSLIELVIAVTKKLAYEKSPNVPGKWVFGQLKLSRPLPRTYGEITVFQKSLVANRFSNNAISVDGEPLGDMRFIVGAP